MVNSDSCLCLTDSYDFDSASQIVNMGLDDEACIFFCDTSGDGVN